MTTNLGILLQDYIKIDKISHLITYYGTLYYFSIEWIRRSMERQNDNINLLQLFIAREEQRSKISIKGSLQAMLDYLEYVIRSEFDKHSKSAYKFKKRKDELNQNYINAVNAMNRQEKVRFYETVVRFIVDIENGNDSPPAINKQMMTVDAHTRSLNLKIWKKKKIRLDREKHILYAQKSDKIKHYNLGDYLIRESKNKDYHSFVLQAINNTPHESLRTVHIGFHDPNKYLAWFKAVKESVDFRRWEFIYKSMGHNTESTSRQSAHTISGNKAISSQVEKPRHQTFSEKRVKPIQMDSSDEERQISNKTPSFNKSQLQEQKAGLRPSEVKSRENSRTQPHKVKVTQVPFESPSKSDNENVMQSHTIVDSLMESDNDEQIDKIQAKDKVHLNQKKHLDLFHKILPDYELEELQSEVGFEPIINQHNFRVIQNIQNKKRVKVFINFTGNYPKEAIFSAIANTSYMTKYNQAVEELNIKTMISSQNSAIIYQKNKSFNKLYRPRDFVFIRHVFANAGDLYIVDKSIQNSSYPPFITIVRGQLCIFWGILKRSNAISLIFDIDQTNQGYLNDLQQLNLTMKYIQGIRVMESRMKNDIEDLLKFKVFDLSWDITKNEVNAISNQVRMRKKTERLELKRISLKQMRLSSPGNLPTESRGSNFSRPQQQKESFSNSIKKEQLRPSVRNQSMSNYKSVQNMRKSVDDTMRENQQSILKTRKDMEKVGEIDPSQLQEKRNQKMLLTIVREFDKKDGYVIVSQNFVRTKYQINPIPNCPPVYQEAIQGHPIWKGQWIHDTKEGGVIFINQKKIEDQKGVLKFILTKIGKNLLSGKSVLSISLPVDIFSAQSNLERLCYCFTCAPVFLQKAVKQNAIQRLKKVIAFGLSNSPLYLNMEKPFNPILGQTFSCWINGCPTYAEQISHHPPIAALYMVGRGYRVSAQLESKVELAMNSGTGINDGVYKVRFDDGMEVCFMTPGGQVSGLTYGDRKFNIVGKSYYWIQKENIVVELAFNPTKKGFFSMGKQEQPSDYVEGTVYECKPDFMDKFLAKKRAPTDKQFSRELGKVSGIWNKFINFNNERIYDLDKDYPVKLQYEANPLPSDANWREDIAYRRIQQISRAQTEKERLEVFQRADRKLRQAKGKKK